MNFEDVLGQLNVIFRKELDNDSISLRAETTAKDIKGWDSLTHIMLVVAIEKQFKVKFTTLEIRGLQNVGQMCELLLKRLAGR